MSRRLRIQVVTALCLAEIAHLAVSPVPVLAGGNEFQSNVERALQDGWKWSNTGLSNAMGRLEPALEKAPNDVRVRFAHALILIRNKSPREAARELDQLLTSGQKLIPIREVRIYVAMLIGDYAAATRESQALAHVLEGPDDNELHREAAEFLGTVVGYLQKVKGSKAECLEELEREIATSLSGSLAEAFADGQESVADLAGCLDKELLVAREQALARETESKANKLDSLGEKLATTRRQVARIDQEKQEFQSQNSQRYLAATQFVQMAPYLASQLRQQRDNSFMFTAYPSSPRSNGHRYDDDDGRGRYYRNTGPALMGPIIPYGGAQYDFQIAAANYRYAESVAFIMNCNAKMNCLAYQANRIARRQRMQERSQRAFQRIKADNEDGRTSSLAMTRKAFTTYASHLLETERDRLLATYDAK